MTMTMLKDGEAWLTTIFVIITCFNVYLCIQTVVVTDIMLRFYEILSYDIFMVLK